jgi:hypothetical protein
MTLDDAGTAPPVPSSTRPVNIHGARPPMADLRHLIDESAVDVAQAKLHRESKTNRARTDDEHIRSDHCVSIGAVPRRFSFSHDDVPARACLPEAAFQFAKPRP